MGYMYKYRKLYDERTGRLDKYTLNMLLKNEIHFSKPSDFNDPYDSIMQLDTSFTEDDIYKYFKERNLNKEEDIEIMEAIKNYSIDKDKFSEEVKKTFRHRFAIFCLSNVYNNILMWSHYGDNHKGICIALKVYDVDGKPNLLVKNKQFKSVSNESNFTYYPLFPVNYSEERAKIFNIFTYRFSAEAPEFLLTKFKDWSYEEEFRAVLDIEDSNNKFNKQNIILEDGQIPEIMFGSKVPDKIKIKTIKLLSGKKDIIFNKMVLSDNSYKLKIYEYV